MSGQTIVQAMVTTEDYFGVAPQGTQLPPGCQLAFNATGPATISGNIFSIALQLGPSPIAEVSSLAIASTASFTGTPTLQGTFSSATSASGQLNYTINSATCNGTTFAGVIPTPGYGNQLRLWTAFR